MSDVVFILGAGASKQCGAPLMAEFLDVSNRLLRTGEVGDKKDHFEKVFKAIGALQAVHSKAQLDLTNIESIFTALEISNVIGKLPGFAPEEIPEVIASLKEVIVKTLELTIDFPAQKSYIGIPEPYDTFSELLVHIRDAAFPEQSTSVITFNYDIAADMALYRARIGPDYGISSDPGIVGQLVPLLKLHGSLNWALKKEFRTVHPLELKDYFMKYSIHGFDEFGTIKIPIGSHLSEFYSKHTDLEVENEPVIVPPTWNKADYHQVLAKVWGHAAYHLGQANTIFIIGYSLPETDAFFRLLYALGTVGSSPLERIVVYNPDASDVVDSRFRTMLGPGAEARYEYKRMRFDEAISDIRTFFPERKW